MVLWFTKDKKSSSPSSKKNKRRFFYRRSKNNKTPREEKVKYVQAFEKDLERAKVF